MAEVESEVGPFVDTSPGVREGAPMWGLPRGDVAAAVACAAFGVMMSVLPYLLWWPRIGEPVWLADHDEMLYLQVGALSYFHNPLHLGDPAVGPESHTAYSSPVIVPAVVAARAFGAGPLAIGLFLRLGAGVGMGLLTYLLFRQVLGRPFVALAMACLMLADCGLLGCHLLLRPLRVAARLLAGKTGELSALPVIETQWRIINPAPSLPYLLLHVWLLYRARERPTVLRLGLSGLGFGLLFYVYFYFYTAAALALVLALALDAGRRRVYFHTIWVGGLVGLPGVVASWLLKKSTSPDWLQRSDKFVPIPHFSELMIPVVACALLAAGLTWAFVRRRDLLYLGLLALAGVGLANNQVVTGLQIENFHWVYVWGPITCYLTALVAADVFGGRVARSRLAAGLLLGVWAGDLGLGLWLRGVEATRTRESVDLTLAYARYRDDLRSSGSGPLAPDAVIAGDDTFVELAAVLEDQRPLAGYITLLSPYVDDASFHARVALNARLLGLGRSEFEAEQRHQLEVSHWGPSARDPKARAAVLARRLACYDEVGADCRAAVDRFGVRAIALPSGRDLPAALPTGWKKVRDGATWDVWAR